MNILCLSGWQQRKDELASITPKGAHHFDYDAYGSMDAMFKYFPSMTRIAIGWSLGGQLLVRAIAAGHIKPTLLILLSTPFQFLADAEFPHGMAAAGLQEFRKNYSQHPEEIITQFNALIGLGDTRAARVIRALNKQPKMWDNGLFWLDELARVSCSEMDFSSFPQTIIVHGQGDKVIDVANASMFKKQLPQAELLLWSGCGHAPHLHNPDALREIVNKYV